MIGVAVATDGTETEFDETATGMLEVSSGETGLEAGMDEMIAPVTTEEVERTTADELGADSYEPAVGTEDTEEADAEETGAVAVVETTGSVSMVAAVRTVVPLAWVIVAPAGH